MSDGLREADKDRAAEAKAKAAMLWAQEEEV
jgi:hypothetical protein